MVGLLSLDGVANNLLVPPLATPKMLTCSRFAITVSTLGEAPIILSASPQKTEFIVIGHQRRVNEIKELPSLKLNDSEIKRVGEVKSLGVIVDEGLTWNDQFKSLTGKLVCYL